MMMHSFPVKGLGAAVHMASTSLPTFRCLAPSSSQLGCLLSRRQSLVTAMASSDAAGTTDKPRPKDLTAGRAVSEGQPLSDEATKVSASSSPKSRPKKRSTSSQLGMGSESNLNGTSVVAADMPDSNGWHPSEQHSSSQQSIHNGRQPVDDIFQRATARLERPRPKRSSSKSKAPLDEAEQAREKPKRTARKKQQVQGTQAESAQATATPTAAADAAVQPAAGAPAAAPIAVQQTAYIEPDMQLRNKFIKSHKPSVIVGPSQPLSAAAASWLSDLGITQRALQAWQAGMAVVKHPLPDRGQVEVVALPYYKLGKLVDVRYLELSEGRLVASWLAEAKGELYMKDELAAQGASTLVFVSHELDAILLSGILQQTPLAAGIQVIAVPHQWPMVVQDHLPQLQPQQQVRQQTIQHLEQQQQQHQAWPPVLQFAVHRQQQQQRPNRQPARIEDHRLRLQTMAAELKRLRDEHNMGGSKKQRISSSGSGSSEEGLKVTSVTQEPTLGLELMFPQAKYAVIAVDSGPVGDALGAELAGLLGEVSCRRVLWPQTTSPVKEAEGMLAVQPAPTAEAADTLDSADQSAGLVQGQSVNGDAAAGSHGNDEQLSQPSLSNLHQQLQEAAVNNWDFMLVNRLMGPDAVMQCIDNAYIWPIAGLERFTDHAYDLLTYYQTPDLDNLAVSTGWPSLDSYYKVAPGEVTLVTGVPNSGKSEWLDALAVNLARDHGWVFAVCSMEKRPRDHARQLLEKIVGKPMLMAAYAENVQRMTAQELDKAYDFLRKHFVVIASGEDKMPSMKWVLETAKAAKIHYGINGLIVDPFNELDPTRSSANLREHEHVNEIMAHMRRFARENQVHCWLVAHPRQMGAMWQGQRPGLQDISGGANFMNKTDNGIVVHRNWSKLKELQQKAKEKAGKQSSGKKGDSDDSRRTSAAGSNAPGNSGEGVADTHKSEFEVQVFVEKVRNKTSGSRGDAVLVYDRVTGRYHELDQQPDRQHWWSGQQDAARWDDESQVEVLDAVEEDEGLGQSMEGIGQQGVSSTTTGPEEEEAEMQRLREHALEGQYS